MEPTPDNPKRVAILYGPIVLAADMGPAPTGRRRRNAGAIERTPVLISSDRPIDSWLQPETDTPLGFKTVSAGKPAELTFKPFYSLYHERAGVYLDEFTPSEWDVKEAEYRAEESRVKDLEARTVDSMLIGQMQPERDHHLTQERNDVREQNGRGTRQPLLLNRLVREFEMKVGSVHSTQRFGDDLLGERSQPSRFQNPH